jgi:hypothetical protein
MDLLPDNTWEEFSKRTEEKRKEKYAKNLREDKINAILEDKEFVYNDKRHNPNWRLTSDTGSR